MNLADASRSGDPPTARPFEERDLDAWAAFVETSPDATFFHRIEWKRIIEEVFGHRTHYLVAERDGNIVGVLPLCEIKSVIFGHSLVSLPFAVYGGAAVTDEAARVGLHAAAADLSRRLGVQHLELRNRVSQEPAWPQQDLYVTFRKSLAPTVDANLLAIPRKQRAMVRKGIKHGLNGELDTDVNRFFDIYADSMHRHGTPPFPKKYFTALRHAFGEACEVLTVLGTSGQPLSTVLSFYFRDEVLPYYAGDCIAAREVAANDFKYWDLMRRACERGVRVFDYGRSKRGTGSFDFKKNWGFEPTPLAYEYLLLKRNAIPQNNPANPKYRAFIALWRRLPRCVVNAAGPVIVRNLG